MEFRDDISIVLCGEAGQGIKTIEELVSSLLKQSGYNIFASKEYMSRVRGGSNSTLIRVSSKPVSAWKNQIDLLIPLDHTAIPHLGKRITDETIIIGEINPTLEVKFSEIAKKIGNPIYSNVVAVGVIAGLFKMEMSLLQNAVNKYFAKKSQEIIDHNIEAIKEGYRKGLELSALGKIQIDFRRNFGIKKELLINGTEAIALGALASGCNFISSYPMTPGSGVLTSLAKYAQDFPIIVEQAEDEMSAVNMVLGAWYAGARAMVTTSGGGFALMVEGLSLSGMIETPLVIHLAQRPGPATGLPTRTEQGDLNFALYSGHGEFPRIILAPGKVEDAFFLTNQAFYLADKYQIPVIILTDQHLVDSYYNVKPFDLEKIKTDQFIIQSPPDYKRYKLSEDGVSPRAIPGFGDGIVCVDSDEHDEEGHITEDLDLRVKMVDKRLSKVHDIVREAIAPELIGPEKYKTLIIGWGSTYPVIKEALERLKIRDLSFLYFKQVYPIALEAEDYLKKAKRTIIIENNATSQFGNLLKLTTGADIDEKILKYNGLPFSVEELEEKIKEVLGG